MKKRTSSMFRRIVSLLMSLVLTLTLVTPAAFATEVVGGSGTAIIEGNANPADPAPGEDSENNEDKNTEDGKDEQPTNPGDEDKNPTDGDGEDANKPDGDKKDEENKDEQNTEEPSDEIDTLEDEGENAVDAVTVWDGSAATKFAGGTGTVADPYRISNGAELAYLAQLVNDGNDFSTKTVTLTNNIDLNNKAWTPIGNSDSVFAGTFDGNGHTISGLYINITGSYSPAKKGRLYQGLFGCVEDGTVRNLIVTGSVTIGNEKSVNVSYIGGIVGINDGGDVQNCGFYGTVSAKQNVLKTPKDCTKDNGGVVGKGKAAKCWYFCTDIKSASPLGACGGFAANCYQNVSEDVAKGDYINDLNSFKAVLQMNAAGSDMWKPGEKHPEFLQESEKLVVLQPLFDDTTAAVQVNGSKEGAVVTDNTPIVLTGEDVYYRVGENGKWTKIDSEASADLDGTDQVVTIYYASAEELQSIKWYDPNVNEFVLTTAGQLTYLAQLVNGGTDFAGKTIRLGSDIEISKTWAAPIGTQFKSFKGTFDGEGHVVSVKDGTTFGGLFGYNDGTIRNVIVTGIVDASSVAGPNVGGIAGTSRKTIQNCGFYGKFENIEGKTLCGVANASSGVENCWFYNTGEGSVDVAGNQYNKPKNSYVNKGESAKLGGELVSENFAAVVAEKLNDALADSWFPWVTREGCNYPVMLIEGKLVNVTSYDGADDTIVTIGDSGTTSAAVTENTVTLKLADSYTGETVYIISDPAEEVVIDGENATPRLTSASRTCVYTLPDGQRFVKLYYGTADKLNADDSWYDTNADKMTIMSAKQLRTFAGMVNAGTDFAGKTIMLGADIVLPGEWTPIGTAEHPFKGTFDGCIEISDNNYKYYAVSGAEVNAAGPNAGLFGVVDGGKVQNLTVAGSVSSEAKDAHVGGIVGWLKAGTVETCVFIGSVEAAGENAVRGGLVGKAESTDSVSDGYCYSAEDVKPVGDGAYTKCFYLAAKSTRGAANDNGARTEQEFSIGRVAWELLGENEQFKNTAPKPHWAQENGMPVIESYVSLYYLYEVELVKRSGSEGLSVIMQANGTNALLDGDTQRVYVAEAEEITIDSGGIDDNYTVTYSPKDPCTGINKYTWGMPNNTFYYTISAKTNEDISWYIGQENVSEYTLETTAQLFGFAALVNGTAKRADGTLVNSVNFSGKTIYLANDVDVSGYEWIAIGYSDGYTPTAFAGTFDGKGHTVTLTLDTIGQNYVGFFGYVTGTVKNLTVDGSVKADSTGSNGIGHAAGVVAYLAGGTVEMCVNRASVTTDKCCYTAGIVGGSENGKIKNCRNTGEISSTYESTGGHAAGIANEAESVTQCWNEGDIELKTVKGNSSNSRVAGVATGAPVLNSANFGKVSGPTWAETGVSIGGVGTTAVSNSYNLGTVTGAAGKTYNISGGTVVNSYYADIAGKTGIYVKDSAGITDADKSQSITITEVDGKKAYKVGNVELVDVLNGACKNISGALEWINKQEAPNNPVHITRWDGSFEPGVKGVITLVYDPNGGEGAAVTEQQRVEGDTDGSFTIKSDTELGFKHENGTFLGWSKTAGGEVAFKLKNDGSITPASVSVKKDETLTLYAVWSPIWAGSGTEAAPYEIPDVGKLTALQTQVNENGFSYSGKWFRLTNNIDLNNEPWTPIGVDTGHPFSGSLNGSQKSISGLNVNTSTQYAGLFGTVGEITVQSLTLQDGSVICTGATSWCGGLAGNGSLLLSDVHIVNMAISGDGIGGTGGILGGGYASMTACSNTGGSVSGRYAGGLAGRGNTNGTDFIFTDCNNSAAVTGRNYAGGMAGSDRSESMEFTNCSNAGNIRSEGSANGIAAAGTFVTCTNTGAISSSQGRANGIAEYAKDITQCGNTGAINGSTAAGIAWHAIRIEKCYNTGKITATAGNAAAYGIAGSVRWYIKNSFTYNVDTQVPLVSNIKFGTYGDKNEVTNSYYLASSATAVSSAGEYATLADFASGKVAWGVDGGTGAHANYWTQDTRRGQNQMPAGPGRAYPKPIEDPNTEFSVYRALVQYGTGGTVSLEANSHSSENQENAVYGMKGTSVTIKATPKDNTFGLKSLTWTHNGQTDVLPAKGTTNIVMPAESNVTIHAEFASVGPGGNGGYYYGGSGDGTGTGDKDDEGLQDGLNMDVEYDIKGLVLGAYAEWGSNGGNKSFQKWLEENPNVVRALLTNSLDNMATAAVGKKTDEAKDLAALLLASLNEHTGVDGKDGDTIAKALQKYIDSGSEEVFSAWLTGGGGMASGTYESIYGQYASSLAALADRLYSKWEASGTSMTFPVWLDSQQVSMDSLSENADEPDTDNTNDPQTSDAPDDVPDGQDTEGGASGNSVWEIIGTVVRENPILVWSIVAVIAALIIVGAVRRYHKVKRDERDDNGAE